jgi:hypothetical protein
LALAAALRTLPDFRGRVRIAQLLRRGLLKSLSPSQAVRSVRLHDGSRMIIDVRSDNEWWTLYTGRYDKMLPKILELLPEQSAAIDVGAHIGFYTIPIALRLRPSGGKCVAFEPVPSNYARLCKNVVANGLDDVVQTFPLPLGEDNLLRIYKRL